VGSMRTGILPTHNFQRGQFEHTDAISGEHLKETILVGEGTCFACAVTCSGKSRSPNSV